MNKIIGIYKITSPSGKVYIGQSIDIKRRIKRYKIFDCKEQGKIYRSLKKYGVKNHKFEIITECDIQDLNKLERYYQDLYDACGEFGLNLTLTASDNKRFEITEYTRLKMSESRKGEKNHFFGKTHTEESKLKISQANKGNKFWLGKTHTDESKLKMSESHKGRIVSEDARKKMSLASKGKQKTEEHKKNISDGRKRKYQTDKKFSDNKPKSKNIIKEKEIKHNKQCNLIYCVDCNLKNKKEIIKLYIEAKSESEVWKKIKKQFTKYENFKNIILVKNS